MKRILLILGLSFAILSVSCKQKTIDEIEVIFFDPDIFEKTDTLIITNADTIRRITELFQNMKISGAKFPLTYKISFVSCDVKSIYYTNGLFVEVNNRSYKLPFCENLEVFQRQLKKLE